MHAHERPRGARQARGRQAFTQTLCLRAHVGVPALQRSRGRAKGAGLAARARLGHREDGGRARSAAGREPQLVGLHAVHAAQLHGRAARQCAARRRAERAARVLHLGERARAACARARPLRGVPSAGGGMGAPARRVAAKCRGGHVLPMVSTS